MLETCKRIYESVNVTGRINNASTSQQAWHQAAVRQEVGRALTKANVDPAAPRSALARLGTHSRDVVTASSVQFKHHMTVALQAQRFLAPLSILSLPKPNSRDLGVLGELAVGRGQSQSAAPTFILGGGGTDILRIYDGFTQTGLLGVPLEVLPTAAAAHFERQGKLGAASACLVGAILGRALLQPLRLLTTAATLVAACKLAAELSVIDMTVQLVGLTLSVLYLPLRPFYGATTPLHTFGIRLRDALRPNVFRLPSALDNHLHWDVYGPPAGPTDEPAHFMRSSLLTLNSFTNPSTENAARLANRIVEQFVFLCRTEPNDISLRRGLNQIEAFMALRFADARWHPAVNFAQEHTERERHQNNGIVEAVVAVQDHVMPGHLPHA